MRLLFAFLLAALVGCASGPGVAQETHLIEVQNQSWDLVKVSVYCGTSLKGTIHQVGAIATVRKPVSLANCHSVWFVVSPLAGQAFRTESMILDGSVRVITLTIQNAQQHSSVRPRTA